MFLKTQPRISPVLSKIAMHTVLHPTIVNVAHAQDFNVYSNPCGATFYSETDYDRLR